jgi:hypothetical protein
VFFSEALAAGGDHQACRQALDVPIEGAAVGFIEIVDVENERPLG